MWAVGENCANAMKFEILGFTGTGARLLHTFFAQMDQAPQFFQGGGAFQAQGGLFR